MPLVPEFLGGRSPPDLYQAYIEPAFVPWTEALIELVEPRGRMIDIACGTGLVSRMAAGHPQVEAIEAIDVAAPMVTKAKSLAGDAADKVRFVEASALNLPFSDTTFDCALCQQGLQFFPDKLAGMREAHRVLKPGARAGFSIWCSAKDGLPLFEAFEDVVASELGEDLVPFGPFSYGDQQVIADMASEAGFTIVSLEAESRLSAFPDPRTFVLFDLAFLGRPAPDGTLQPILDFEDPASDEVIERIIAHVQREAAPYLQSDGTLLAPMKANVLLVEA